MHRGLTIKSSLYGASSTLYVPSTDNATVYDDILLPDDGNDYLGNKEIKNKKTEKLEEKIRIFK